MLFLALLPMAGELLIGLRWRRSRWEKERVAEYMDLRRDPQSHRRVLVGTFCLQLELTDREGRLAHPPSPLLDATHEQRARLRERNVALGTLMEKSTEYGIALSEAGRWVLVEWRLQPNGQYWAENDGCGGNFDTEIIAYAAIRQMGYTAGRFSTPFILTDSAEQARAELGRRLQMGQTLFFKDRLFVWRG
jgi:hypothetical protein